MATKTRYMVPAEAESVALAKAIADKANRDSIPTTYTAILRSALKIGIAELAKKFDIDTKNIDLLS